MVLTEDLPIFYSPKTEECDDWGKKRYNLSLTLVMVFTAAVNVSLNFPDLRDKIAVLYSIWGVRDTVPEAGS